MNQLRPKKKTNLLRRTANISRFFFILPPQISFISSPSRVVFSWNCGRDSRPWTTRIVCLGFSELILCEPRRPQRPQSVAQAIKAQGADLESGINSMVSEKKTFVVTAICIHRLTKWVPAGRWGSHKMTPEKHTSGGARHEITTTIPREDPQREKKRKTFAA